MKKKIKCSKMEISSRIVELIMERQN